MCATEATAEEVLVENWMARDPAAWDEFHRRYERPIRKFIAGVLGRTRGRQWDQTDDIFQDFCLALLRGKRSPLRRFDPQVAPLEVFLTAGICWQICKRFLRTESRRVLVHTPLAPEFEPENHRENPRELEPLLAEILPRLSPKLRKVLLAIQAGDFRDNSAVNRQRVHRLRKAIQAASVQTAR
jgi:DNA-directed RNA polymerase specialized sigma24 family protein